MWSWAKYPFLRTSANITELFFLVCYGSYLYKSQFARDMEGFQARLLQRDRNIAGLKRQFRQNLLQTNLVIDQLWSNILLRTRGRGGRETRRERVMVVGKLSPDQSRFCSKIFEEEPWLEQQVLLVREFAHAESFFRNLFGLNPRLFAQDYVSGFSIFILHDLRLVRDLQMALGLDRIFRNKGIKVKISGSRVGKGTEFAQVSSNVRANGTCRPAGREQNSGF